MEFDCVKQILSGDVSKFSFLIERYKDLAYNIAFRILNNNEDAEEAVQDAFLRAFKALSLFKGNAKFSTWFYKIVVNVSLSRLKSKNQNAKGKFQLATGSWQTIIDADLPSTVFEEVESAYKNLHREDQRKYINLALDKLDMEDRLLLTLYYLNENTIAEVAEITSIQPENIKMKIHRARQKMFVLLKHLIKEEILDHGR